MNKDTLNKEKINARIEDIKSSKEELERFRDMETGEFESNKDNYAIASYHLRVAIEAVLTIGTHILSRMPSNGKDKDYTQVVLPLADHEVIPKDFAEKIKGMAGYRNRLVHLYWEVTPEELLSIIKEDIDDLTEFVEHIKEFLEKA